MPKYIIRITAVILRDEDAGLLSYPDLPTYIDVPINESTPEEARALLGQLLGALIIEVQKGKIVLLNG